jgi:hypothetical protein
MSTSSARTDLAPATLTRYRKALPELTTRTASSLAAAGVRPVDAQRYAAVGVCSRNDMMKLSRGRLYAQSLAPYLAADLSLEEALQLWSAGLSAADLAEYRQLGVTTIAQACKLRAAGVWPSILEGFLRLGVSPSEAVKLRVKPWQVTQYRSEHKGCSVAQAEVLARVGALAGSEEANQLVSMPLAAATRVAELSEKGINEIERRGGEINIESLYGVTDIEMSGFSSDGKHALFTAEGWRAYGARARWVRLNYLVGFDDGQIFAVRVPSTVTTVADALACLDPAEVAHARAAGIKVLRQGDVYAVASRDKRDRMVGIERHNWDSEARELRHPEHGSLNVPFPARLVQQSNLGMGRGGVFGAGD